MRQHINIPQTSHRFNSRNLSSFPATLHGQNDFVDVSGIIRDAAIHAWRSEEYHALYVFAKRVIDILGALLLIIAAFPILIAIVLLIKTTSRGPVIFKHRRIGQFGNEFDCWKFRTMVCDAEEILKNDPKLRAKFDMKFKIDDDPRVTKLGAFLRRSSFDELPQLFQVVQGKLSLIGPRPVIKRELEKYSIYQKKLLSVKPGLSGLWQTSGRSDVSYPERVLLDMKYIDHRSLRLDLRLIMLTAVTVLKRSGAC